MRALKIGEDNFVQHTGQKTLPGFKGGRERRIQFCFSFVFSCSRSNIQTL